MCIFNNWSSLALPTDSKGRYCNLIHVYPPRLSWTWDNIKLRFDLIFILFTHMLFSNYQVFMTKKKKKSGNLWKHLCCTHKECELIDLLNCHRLRFYNLKTYHNEQVNISWIKKNLFQLTLLLSSPPYIKCSKPNLQLIMIWRINNIVVQNLQSSLVLFYCLLFFSFLFCALLLFLYTLNHSLYVVDLYSVTSLLIKYPYI